MCKVRSDETYGYTVEVWEKAKQEAIGAIVREGHEGRTISYSDLTKRISSIGFDPHDYLFHHFLGQISTDEDAAGRGMLTALVVHKDDGMPGQGFWDLAADLGRDVRDRTACWAKEVGEVMDHCKRYPLAV